MGKKLFFQLVTFKETKAEITPLNATNNNNNNKNANAFNKRTHTNTHTIHSFLLCKLVVDFSLKIASQKLE